jgi:hypothetical protein
MSSRQAERHGAAHASRSSPASHGQLVELRAVELSLGSAEAGAQLAAAGVRLTDELVARLTEAFWWLMIETRILLAPALAALGRDVEAATRLEEAAALLAAHPDAGMLPDWGNRFGPVYVDFDTLERKPKLSAEWFREAARQNAVV